MESTAKHPQQPSSSSRSLYRITFNNSYDFLSDADVKKILSIIKKRETVSELISIDKIRDLQGQAHELDNLAFELRTGSEIVQHLIATAVKLQDNRERFIGILNNISCFIYDGIINKAQKAVDELNQVLEHEMTAKSNKGGELC